MQKLVAAVAALVSSNATVVAAVAGSVALALAVVVGLDVGIVDVIIGRWWRWLRS